LEGKPLDKFHLEGREVDGKITLSWNLRRCVMKMGCGRNWLSIVFKSGLLYQRCRTFGFPCHTV